MLHPEVLEHRLELVQQPLLGHLVGRRVGDRDAAVVAQRDAVLRAAAGPRSRARSRPHGGPPSRSVHSGASRVWIGFSPRNIAACDLPTIWMLPSGKSKSSVAEVEVVEPERLLEDRRVLLLGQRQHGLAVVEHVVAPDLVGAVGQAVGVARRWPTPAAAWRCSPRRRTTTTMSAVNVSRAPSWSTTTPVTARARGVGLQPHASASVEQRDVGVLERRAHAEHLGVGLGVHEAREAVAVVAAHAGAEAACCPRRASRRTARGTDGARPRRGRRRAAGCAARARPPGTGTARWPAARSGSSPRAPWTW